jgi:hypothetical protein
MSSADIFLVCEYSILVIAREKGETKYKNSREISLNI